MNFGIEIFVKRSLKTISAEDRSHIIMARTGMDMRMPIAILGNIIFSSLLPLSFILKNVIKGICIYLRGTNNLLKKSPRNLMSAHSAPFVFETSEISVMIRYSIIMKLNIFNIWLENRKKVTESIIMGNAQSHALLSSSPYFFQNINNVPISIKIINIG